MTYPPIQIVDEQDKPIGQADMFSARKKGLIHRIVRIMIEDDKGMILLQKRSDSVATYPNCWDHSAAGHVDAGESYMEAAKRELAEEIGIKNVELKEIARYYTQNKTKKGSIRRFNAVYKGLFNATPTDIEPSEVTEVKWFTLQQIKELIQSEPDTVTDGLVDVITRYYP